MYIIFVRQFVCPSVIRPIGFGILFPKIIHLSFCSFIFRYDIEPIILTFEFYNVLQHSILVMWIIINLLYAVLANIKLSAV